MQSMMNEAIVVFVVNWRGSTTLGSSTKCRVVDVDLAGDRRLILRHTVFKGAQINETDTKRVLQHLAIFGATTYRSSKSMLQDIAEIHAEPHAAAASPRGQNVFFDDRVCSIDFDERYVVAPKIARC